MKSEMVDSGAPRIRLLGPLEIATDGDPVPLGGPKQQAVLALLAARADEVVPADTLIDLLWAGDGPANPQQSLQVYVSSLRGVFQKAGLDATIDRRGGGYVLRLPADRTDAQVFATLVEEGVGLVGEQPGRAVDVLRQALGLWRGRPLGGLGDHAGFQAEVARLEETRLRAEEALIEAELAHGRGGELVGELQRLVDDHPLRETFWQQLMVALYRAGRHGEALEAYEAARSTLAEELGADPSPALQDLHAAILRHDPGLRVQPVPEAPTDIAAMWTPSPVRGVSSTELVGRGTELAEMLALLETATAGEPRVLLLGGDAGVGKSRLVDELRREVISDVDVLVGRCLDLGEGGLPFAPISQVLRTIARQVPPGQLTEVLGPARRELVRIVPELGDDAPEPAEGSELTRARLFSAVLGAFERMTRSRPVVIALEDIHWADRSTLDLLAFLARNLDRERLLLVATFRTDELHRRHPLRGVLGELTRVPGVVRLDVGPLDDEQVSAQLRSILDGDPDPDVVRRIVARSGGNPFFVEELVAAIQEGGSGQLPSSVRDVVAARLDRLPDETRNVLDVVAVAGRQVDQRLLAAATGEDAVALAGRLRPAVERHILVADEAGYEFRHDLVREVVEDELLPGERTALHRRVAEVLEAQPEVATARAEQVDAELAHHWYAALELQRAFEASLRAASRARETAAFMEALGHGERALELWDRVDTAGYDRIDVLWQAAEMANHARRYGRAIQLLRSALETLEDDAGREAELRCLLAGALWWDAADFEEAREEARRAHELLADAPDSPSKAETVHTLARLHMLGGAYLEAIPVAREAVELARVTGARRTEANARVTLGTSLCRVDVGEGIRELEAGIAIARQLEDRESIVRGLNNLLAMHRDETGAGRDVIEELVSEVLEHLDEEPHHETTADVVALCNVAFDAVMAGRWDRADEMLERIGRRHLEGADLGFFLAVRMTLRWMRGQLDDARDDAARVHDLGIGGPWYPTWACMTEAMIAADQGRFDDLHDRVARGRSMASGFGHQWDPTLMAILMLTAQVRAEADVTLAAEGAQRDEHRRNAGETLAEMRRLFEEQTPATPGVRRWAEGSLALAEGEMSRADEAPEPDLWREAIDRVMQRYWRIYARWRLGEALLSAGDREQAETELRAAHREASQQGTEQLRDWIEGTADAAGISVS